MSRSRVLVADKVATEGVDFLRDQPDIEVDFAPGLDPDALRERIRGARGLIVRSGVQVDADLLGAADELRVVGRAGIGVDNIDLATATERGVVVLNTPDANARTTAELTVAHILGISRHLQQADASVRGRKWQRAQFVGTEVSGKTVGVVGFGTIGRIVAGLCRGLGMRVVAYDPFVTAEVFSKAGVEPLELDTLVRAADYVTLHCPLNDKTRGLIDERRIGLMKPGARLINCARGGLVEEQALYDALESGRLAGAALDVYEEEPPFASPLLDLANVSLTPHLGASTEEAQIAVGVEIARLVVEYLRTDEAVSAVNLPPVSSDTARRLRPYLLLANRLGRLVGLLAQSPIRELEVSLRGRASELDGHPLVREALVGLLGRRLSQPVNRVNALHVAKRQGIATKESRSTETHQYLTLIELTAHTAHGTVSVAGTLYDERHPRLVRFDGHEVEAFLQGHLLVTVHADQPGVVGDLGVALASEELNISRMQLAAGTRESPAMAVLEVSQPVSPEAMGRIRALDAIEWAAQITL